VNPVVESVNSVAESGNSALKYPMSTPLTDSEASLIVFAKPRDKSDVIRTLRGQAAVLSRFGGKDGKLNQVQTDIDTLIREGGDELNKKWPSQQPETVNSPPPPKRFWFSATRIDCTSSVWEGDRTRAPHRQSQFFFYQATPNQTAQAV
jgi:hypothetical protein